MQTIKDFAGRTNIILKADDPNLKEFGNPSYGRYPAHEFSKPFILVLKVIKYNDTLSQIQYFKRGSTQQYHIVVPNDFKVVVSESKLAQKIMDNYVLENMFSQIYRLSMTIGSDPEMFVEDENGIVIRILIPW